LCLLHYYWMYQILTGKQEGSNGSPIWGHRSNVAWECEVGHCKFCKIISQSIWFMMITFFVVGIGCIAHC
jgi:hypothetical protein